MSKKLIDNIFTYDSYRYVPEDLKLEWKTLYNYYSTKYFDKQHKIYSIFPQNRIDFYSVICSTCVSVTWGHMGVIWGCAWGRLECLLLCSTEVAPDAGPF